MIIKIINFNPIHHHLPKANKKSFQQGKMVTLMISNSASYQQT